MSNEPVTDPLYTALKEWGKTAEDLGELDNLCLFIRLHTDAFERVGQAEDLTIDGAMFVLIARGRVAVSRNGKSYQVEGASCVFFEPGSKLSIGTIDAEEAEIYTLYFTRPFIEDLNLSLTAFTNEEFLSKPSPETALTEKELSQMLRYFKIIRTVMDDDFNDTLNRHIVSSLVSSMIYQTSVFMFKRQGVSLNERVPSRRSTYVREFVRLVHLNYTRERAVLFYANKLCVSPKYLSILVKESTGRSAAAWIDHFVIMEAKNLLRFSGKNVQQVAYALNFVNQSAFGKYFKHLTGMSPSEYQRKT